MLPSAPARPQTVLASARPLFGGYALVALVAAWLTGIGLQSSVSLVSRLPIAVWIAGALIWLLLALVCRMALSRLPVRTSLGSIRLLLGAALLALGLCTGGARSALATAASDANTLTVYATGGTLHVQGDVLDEPVLYAGYRTLTLDVQQISRDGTHWQPASGRIAADISGADSWYAPTYGDTISTTGKLKPIAAGGTPSTLVARLTGARARVVARGGGNPVFTWLFALRVRMAQALEHAVPEPEAALLIGIVLGLKTPMLRVRLPLFTATGTIHMVVPAGLKVALLAQMSGDALRVLGWWPRTIGAMLAVAAYAALGGGGPAAVRAALMGGLLVLAPAVGRVYNVYTALALAAFVMSALDPLVLYDASFQLTMLGTLGLPLLVPTLQRWLSSLLRRWRNAPLTEVVTESLAVTLAAQIATLPVLALTFAQISLIAPLANLLAVPLLAPLLVLGMLIAVLGVLPVVAPAAVVVGWAAWPLLWFVDTVIAVCARLPFASLAVSGGSFALAALYYIGLALALWALRPALARWLRRTRVTASTPPTRADTRARSRAARAVLATITAVSLLGAVGATGPALASGNRTRLDFLDLGPGGEATLLRLPNGVSVLLDGGPDGPTLESALATSLPFWHRTINLAMLTDPRAGDARGLEDATAHFSVGQAVDMGMVHPTQEYVAWLDALRQAHVPHTVVREHATLTLGAGTSLQVLAPPQQLYPSGGGSTTASNDAVLRLDAPGIRVLFLGSADAYALDALANSGESLTSDVVEVAAPHNTPLLLTGSLLPVLARAHPRLVVITESPLTSQTSFEAKIVHDDLAASDADLAQALGATVERVSETGTLDLTGDASGWTLSG